MPRRHGEGLEFLTRFAATLSKSRQTVAKSRLSVERQTRKKRPGLGTGPAPLSRQRRDQGGR